MAFDRVPPDALVPFKKGEVIKRAVINALIEFARGRGVPGGRGEFVDAGPGSRRRQEHSRDELSWLRCEAEVDAPEYSVVEVYDARLDPDGITLIVREATADATVLAGNEAYELINGALGWVKLLTPYEPIIINVDEASDVVIFGDELDVTGLSVQVSSGGPLIALTAESGPAGTGTGTGPLSKSRVAVLAPSGRSGDTLPLVRYEILTPDCSGGSALAVITAVSCGMTSPSAGDHIQLLDEDGWFSGETNTTLSGRTGTAHKFDIPSGYDDCSYVIVTLSPAPFEC